MTLNIGCKFWIFLTEMLHGAERPFPCHVCGKGFITLSNLSRHLKLHRGMD